MDFSADSEALVDAFSNATVTTSTATFRAIYDAPGRQGGVFGEQMMSTDPQFVALQSAVVASELRNGSPLVVSPDSATSAPLDYVIKAVLPDGAGLSICALKKG